MFYCEHTKQITKPSHKMERVVVQTRAKTYFDAEGEQIGYGHEIVREIRTAAGSTEKAEVKPLIVHEGKNKDKTIDTYRQRAMREGRTVYITSAVNVGGRPVVKVIHEITPQGVLREIPPIGLAVGPLDHVQDQFIWWAAENSARHEANRYTKQAIKKMAGLALFGKLVEHAQEVLKEKAS